MACLYAPSGVADRLTFFSDLDPHWYSDRDSVLLVQHICVCDSVDTSGPDVYIDRSVRRFKELAEQCDLLDVAKHYSRAGKLKYTWFQSLSHARSDVIYIFLTLANHIRSYDLQPVFFL